MSADNWACCPRCRKKDHGLVPMNNTESLREDYELGIDKDGMFNVVYHGECETCGFLFTFRHSKNTNT